MKLGSVIKYMAALTGAVAILGGSCPGPHTNPDVTPEAATVGVGLTQSFSANKPVSWSVTEPSGGTITQDGIYTAPLQPGAYHVVATSTDGSGKSGASVNVVAGGLGVGVQ